MTETSTIETTNDSLSRFGINERQRFMVQVTIDITPEEIGFNVTDNEHLNELGHQYAHFFEYQLQATLDQLGIASSVVIAYMPEPDGNEFHNVDIPDGSPNWVYDYLRAIPNQVAQTAWQQFTDCLDTDEWRQLCKSGTRCSIETLA